MWNNKKQQKSHDSSGTFKHVSKNNNKIPIFVDHNSRRQGADLEMGEKKGWDLEFK